MKNKKAKLTLEGDSDMMGASPAMAMMAGPSPEEKERRCMDDALHILSMVQRMVTIDGKQIKKSPKTMAILEKVETELEGLLGEKDEIEMKKGRFNSTLFQR